MNVSADEIPHENYDLVGSDLDVVIALLNSSIAYSELALMAMYNQSMAYVEQNLSVVRGILIPASNILEDIEEVASSYENLSELLPPFVGLSTEEDSFASMESELLVAKQSIVSASELENLTGEDKLAAIEAIQKVNRLILQMDASIDEMLVRANGIIALEVEDERPFSENDLIPLIEKLRDLLLNLEREIDDIVRHGIPWSEAEPFVLLWLAKEHYYLGEDIVGGGYVYINGSFVSGHSVQLLMDGDPLTSSTTTVGGSFYFSHTIPLDPSWVGSHSIQASAATWNSTIYSDTIPISISLIPTTIILTPNMAVMSMEEELALRVRLLEVHGLPLGNAPFRLVVDGSELDLFTSPAGTYGHSIQAADLGYGMHEFQAFYDGELPYASSASAIVKVVVNIPTSVELNLFSTRYRIGMYVVGNGHLFANDTTPLANQTVTLFVDDAFAMNVTTRPDGSFAFTIETEGMEAGAHTLRASFLYRDSVWRYSQDEEGFTIYTLKPGRYPFWPYIPGWGDMFPIEEFPYLFFGEYAYLTWLLVIALIGVLVKTLQVRSKRRTSAEGRWSTAIEPLETTAPAPFEMASSEEFEAEIAAKAKEPSTPNERIVWYYRALLNFLTTKRGIGLRESMTHWEVARMLRTLGYPQAQVERATILFEKAFYSGLSLDDSDTIMMSSALSQLVGRRGKVVSGAA